MRLLGIFLISFLLISNSFAQDIDMRTLKPYDTCDLWDPSVFDPIKINCTFLRMVNPKYGPVISLKNKNRKVTMDDGRKILAELGYKFSTTVDDKERWVRDEKATDSTQEEINELRLEIQSLKEKMK